MMKWRPCVAVALAAIFLCGCRASESDAPAANQSATTEQAQPALWLVSDSDTQIYLLGTVHSLPADLQWRGSKLDEVIAKSGTLVIEVLGTDDPAQTVLIFNKLGHSSGLPPIESRVAPELRPRLAEAAKAAGLSLSTLNGYETWAAALVLSNKRVQRAGYVRGAGVEAVLTQQFRAANKPIEALETVPQQYGYFDVLPEAEQRIMLANALSDAGKSEAQIESAVDAWADGEPDRLAAAMNSETDAMPVLKRLLLTDRNSRWADWIKQALNRPGTILVAVGAGHLAGPGSVQEALAAKGLRVTRIQ